MKKLIGVITTICLSITLCSGVMASPAGSFSELLQEFSKSLSGLAGEAVSEPDNGLDQQEPDVYVENAGAAENTIDAQADQNGESAEESAGESDAESAGESSDGPGGESAGESSGDQGAEQTIEEPDGSGIPKDEPVSTTGQLYGYQGSFDLDSALQQQLNFSLGKTELNDMQLIFWGGSAIQNSGNSSLVVRNSYIRGETAVQTAPLAGNPGNLLVAGNIRTTLGIGNSENVYINSTIVSRNWAALSTDAAEPALKEGQKELSLYAYGTQAITMDGGYGAYSDLFCNLYVFGSHIQAAEIGIISGTYGKVTAGTIEDGENNAVIAANLTDADKALRSDRQLGSVVEGGRNAMMIHSVNLPPYWEYEGYSQDLLPWLHTEIIAHKTLFRTDMSLDKGVSYEPQKQAYIDHTKGSVILIKSTNVNMDMDSCELVPDENGTGYLIQTVYNNDTMFMNAVPDGEEYPGICITMKDMDITGDIAHEDYQRDFLLILDGSSLSGAVNEYDCDHWVQAAEEEGFTDYSLDESYNTHHCLKLTLSEGSVWNVTKESHLSRLYIGTDCTVNGIIYVNGTEQPGAADTAYEGDVVVMPGTPAGQQVQQPETKEPETQQPETAHIHNWQLAYTVPASCTDDGYNAYTCYGCGETTTETIPAKGHNWQHFGGSPATCTTDGTYGWVCYDCGANYVEVNVPALGHEWQLVGESLPGCDYYGYEEYVCSRCGETQTFYTDPVGHNWVYQYHVYAACEDPGYDVYECSACHTTDTFGYEPALGHDYIVYPTPGDESMTHTYECWRCGFSFLDYHSSAGLGYCPECGYAGAYGHIENLSGVS